MDWVDSLGELGRAVADGDLEFVKMAIATGDDPNEALFVATVERQKAIALFLLESGADPNSLQLPGWGCLFEVCAGNDLEWVELLSGYGASVGARVGEGEQTELHKAAEDGNLELVQLLVEKAGGRQALERFDDFDLTPLMAAAAGGHLEVLRYLVDQGADVNALVQMGRDGKVGDTAISRAVSGGHVDVVRFLLERGADPYRPGWMWTNAWDQLDQLDEPIRSEMEKALHIPELKRPAQTPYRRGVEAQLIEELRCHGCEAACSFDWSGTKAVGQTFTVQGKALRPFRQLRALDEAGVLAAEGDVDFLVLTREIDVKAFWSRLTIAGRDLELPPGVPPHIAAQLSEDQKGWLVLDRRNYCGSLTREQLGRISYEPKP